MTARSNSSPKNSKKLFDEYIVAETNSKIYTAPEIALVRVEFML